MMRFPVKFSSRHDFALKIFAGGARKFSDEKVALFSKVKNNTAWWKWKELDNSVHVRPT